MRRDRKSSWEGEHWIVAQKREEVKGVRIRIRIQLW
jgi:hypothetical protein